MDSVDGCYQDSNLIVDSSFGSISPLWLTYIQQRQRATPPPSVSNWYYCRCRANASSQEHVTNLFHVVTVTSDVGVVMFGCVIIQSCRQVLLLYRK